MQYCEIVYSYINYGCENIEVFILFCIFLISDDKRTHSLSRVNTHYHDFIRNSDHTHTHNIYG